MNVPIPSACPFQSANVGFILMVGDDHVIANLMVALAGDADLDGAVGLYDYIILKENYGRTDATWADGDFNYDGKVNRDDLLILKANFGMSIGT